MSPQVTVALASVVMTSIATGGLIAVAIRNARKELEAQGMTWTPYRPSLEPYQLWRALHVLLFLAACLVVGKS